MLISRPDFLLLYAKKIITLFGVKNMARTPAGLLY